MSEHSFSFFNQESHCNACGLSRAQCEDGFSCGRKICVECTLLRQCVGDPPRCEECFFNIQKEGNVVAMVSMNEAVAAAYHKYWKTHPPKS